MAGRLRSGPASHPNLLAGLAALGLVAAVLITSHWLNGGQGRSAVRRGSSDAAEGPYRVGDRVRCPLDRPVLAMSDRRSYPPGHPAHPPVRAGS
jgi:hypothetical protein